MTKRYIQSFATETELLKKIDEMKAQGYTDADIYVLARDKDALSMVRGRTDVDVTSTGGGSWWDRFMGFVNGEGDVRSEFERMGLSDAESTRYLNDIEAGKFVLYVDRGYDDLRTRNDVYRDTDREHLTMDDADRDVNLTDEQRLRLHEEQLHVDKNRVQAGEVNVGKHTVAHEQTIEVPVTHEEVYVERRPVNEAATGDEKAYVDGETIRVPIMEEQVNVSKTDVVKEEVVIGKRQVQGAERVTETVRSEEVDVQDSTTANRLHDADATGKTLDPLTDMDKTGMGGKSLNNRANDPLTKEPTDPNLGSNLNRKL